MVTILQTDALHPDFRLLTAALDADLHARYGAVQEEYDRFNQTVDLLRVLVVYVNNQPAGCGALKSFDADSIELKRVFVAPAFRRMGLARRLLAELEALAWQTGASRMILETGNLQTEAIAFYGRAGYTPIPNYGPYVGMAYSMCFEKRT